MGCWDALAIEWEGLKYYKSVFARLIMDPATKAKTSFGQMFRGIVVGAHYEWLTNPKKTSESVVEEVCGKGNYDALKGKVVIITGATNGLGLENARCLLKYGCHVVFAMRNKEKAAKVVAEMQAKETLTGKATFINIQLDDLSTVKPFVQEFLAMNLPLHCLINNAGIMAPPVYRASKQGLESQFAINNMSHYLLTHLLLPKLKETAQTSGEARVVYLGSLAGEACWNIDLDTSVPSGPEFYSDIGDYTSTKCIDMIHARHLHDKHTKDKIFVCAVHPGIINSGLGKDNPGLTAAFYAGSSLKHTHKSQAEGAATTMYCALSPEVPKKSVTEGAWWYYNCQPQRCIGFASKATPEFQEKLEAKCWDLAKERHAAKMAKKGANSVVRGDYEQMLEDQDEMERLMTRAAEDMEDDSMLVLQHDRNGTDI
ncbi:TIC32B, partial [Symbiodinium sp. KB8]